MNNSPPSPPFLNRSLAALAFVLFMVGVPAATITIFTHFVITHPLLALFIFLIYEIGLFLFGFAAKVWQRLEGSYAENIAKWLDHRFQGVISRYKQQYYDYIRYQHRDLDMKGLRTSGFFALELNQVFVELRIETTTPQKASANPIPVPNELRGRHTIWDYLTFESLSKQNLAIIGPPGSGKTTLLKHIALTLVDHRSKNSPSIPSKLSHKIPILLFLRSYANAINENPNLSLVDALRDHLKKWEQKDPPEGWFERQLTQGRCLIMLDGLDEVADPEARQTVVNWVQQQMAAYHKNRFLVTSRPFGYRGNPLNSVAVLEVLPFTTAQVEEFIHQWYLANEIMSKQKNDTGVHMRANAEANTFLQQLRDTPTLFELTVNPLLLTMITTVHRYGGELPGKRVELYAEICEAFFGKRQQARGQILELSPSQMQLVIEPLAYHMMIKGVREITLSEACSVLEKPLSRVNTQMLPESFLQLVENASGLLLERENGVFSFAHLTFQEYLTAVLLAKRRWGNWLLEKIEMSWWHETIRLYSAMSDATMIIAACLKEDRPSVPVLELAVDCEAEAHEVQPDVRNRLVTLLKQGIEDTEPERQLMVSTVLLSKRLRNMIHLKNETYVDTSLITCAEYQVFLDEQRASGNYLQPDHWTSYHFTPGQGNAPVLGIRSSDAIAFCEWLTERETGPWLYRLPKADELEDDRIISKLPESTCVWLKDGDGVTWINEPLTLPKNLQQKLPVSSDIIDNMDLTNDIVRAGMFDNVLVKELEIVCDRNYTKDRTQVIKHANELANELVHELDRANSRNSKFSNHLNIARNLTNELMLELNSASKLSSMTDFDLSRNIELSSVLNHAFELDNQLNKELDFARQLASTDNQPIFSHQSRAYQSGISQSGFSKARNYASNIASILDRARSQEFIIFSDIDRARELAIANNRNRLSELANARKRAMYFVETRERTPLRKGIRRLLPFGHFRNPQADNRPFILESAINIYKDLLILDERLQGNLPPCEGILLLKERN